MQQADRPPAAARCQGKFLLRRLGELVHSRRARALVSQPPAGCADPVHRRTRRPSATGVSGFSFGSNRSSELLLLAWRRQRPLIDPWAFGRGHVHGDASGHVAGSIESRAFRDSRPIARHAREIAKAGPSLRRREFGASQSQFRAAISAGHGASPAAAQLPLAWFGAVTLGPLARPAADRRIHAGGGIAAEKDDVRNSRRPAGVVPANPGSSKPPATPPGLHARSRAAFAEVPCVR